MTVEGDAKIIENPDSLEVQIPNGVNIISPMAFFDHSDTPIRVLLVLNQEIRYPIDSFQLIWDNTSIKVCADGGADRLYNYAIKNGMSDIYVPDYVVGDLDSLKQTTRDYYESRGTVVKAQHSQYYSDLDKSISLINMVVNFKDVDITKLDDYNELESIEASRSETVAEPNDVLVLAVGGIGGRFDQTIATISRTLQCDKKRPWMDFMLLNSEHLEFVLLVPKGDNFIQFPRSQETGLHDADARKDLRNVGLLPLAGPVVVTTHGLKWDVHNWPTQITGDLSLCNLQVGDVGFCINTSDDLFINIEF